MGKKATRIIILILIATATQIGIVSIPGSSVLILGDNAIGEVVEPISNNTLFLDNDVFCRGMSIADDGYIYIVGRNDTFGQYAIVLTKWDSNANLIWMRVWNNGFSADPYGIVTYGNAIYVVGRYNNGSSIRSFLMKWNDAGELVWMRLWGTPDIGPRATDIALAPDGAIYVVVSAYNITAGYHTSHILKYSLGGTLIWHREMGSVSLLMGQVTVTGLNEIWTYFEGKIKKWNSTGHMLLDYSSISSHIEGSPSGNLYTAVPKDPDGPFELKLYNTSGDQQWSATVHTLWNESLGGIDWVGELAAVPDDSAYILFPLYEAQPNLAMAKYNSSGFQLWNRSIVYPYTYSYGYITQMEVSNEGTVFLASSAIGSESSLGLALCIYEIEEIVPYPIDSFPLFDPDSPEIDHLDDIICEVGHSDFDITWHPFDVAPEHYEIYLNGTLLKSGIWNTTDAYISISVSGLLEGVFNYTLRVFDTSSLNATDSVLVIVQQVVTNTSTSTATTSTTSTTSTTTTYPSNESIPMILALGGALAGGGIIALIIIRRMWVKKSD